MVKTSTYVGVLYTCRGKEEENKYTNYHGNYKEYICCFDVFYFITWIISFDDGWTFILILLEIFNQM